MNNPKGHPAYFFQDIKTHRSFKEGDVKNFVPHLLRKVVELFKVEQAGIWFLNEDKTNLTCYLMYSKKKKKFEKGHQLSISDYPIYFKTMLKNQKIVVNDTLNDDSTRELVDIYLMPNGVSSMMDTAIIEGNKIIGILCLEHKGPKRKWLPEEEIIASCACTFTAQVILLARKKKLEQTNKIITEKNHQLSISLQQVMEVQNKLKQGMEENFSFNVQNRLIPLLDEIKIKYEDEKPELEVLEQYLNTLTSPFYRESHRQLNLSPQELKVAELIRSGHQSKQIGRLLHLSEKTIQTHKKNIRRKLNLKNKKVNLQSFLNQFLLAER